MRLGAVSFFFFLHSATLVFVESKPTLIRSRDLSKNNKNAGKMDAPKNGIQKSVNDDPKKLSSNNSTKLEKGKKTLADKPTKDDIAIDQDVNKEAKKTDSKYAKKAMKDDVKNLKEEKKTDIKKLKDETKKEIQNLKNETKNDIKKLREEKKNDIKVDKQEMKNNSDSTTDAKKKVGDPQKDSAVDSKPSKDNDEDLSGGGKERKKDGPKIKDDKSSSDKMESTNSSLAIDATATDVANVTDTNTTTANTTTTSNGKKQSRIVGGMTVTDKNEFPYIGFPVGDMNCVATLFHDDLLLTAASCKNAFTAGVFLGGTKIDGSQSKRLTVSKSIPHPEFDYDTHANDIMIIKLAKPVTGVPKVKLNLVDMTSPAVNLILDIAGYGATTETGSYSETLQKARVITAPDDRCLKYKWYDYRTMVCTWFPAGGRDSCSGDAGGPVLLKQSTTQVAIISFGLGCGNKENPSVNTRIAAYADFIKKTVCTESMIRPTTAEYCSSISSTSIISNPALLSRKSVITKTTKGKKI